MPNLEVTKLDYVYHNRSIVRTLGIRVGEHKLSMHVNVITILNNFYLYPRGSVVGYHNDAPYIQGVLLPHRSENKNVDHIVLPISFSVLGDQVSFVINLCMKRIVVPQHV